MMLYKTIIILYYWAKFNYLLGIIKIINSDFRSIKIQECIINELYGVY